MTAYGNNLSHECIGNDLSVEQSPAIKCSLKDLIARSAEFRLWRDQLKCDILLMKVCF
jgi:hypothetical protein